MQDGFRIAAVVPAAGLSSRMGRFKPLLPFADGTVVEASVGNALSRAERAVVVLGKRGDELRELLFSRFGERLIFAVNPDYGSTDMFTSVKIGLRAIGECGAFFITPADMPLISPTVYAALADAFTESDEVLLPVAGGRRGHPPLISARLIPEILAYDGADGLRGFYRGHKVREKSVDDNGVLTDLDTPSDYEGVKNEKNHLT